LAHAIPARLSPAEGRRFGLTVGLAFLAFAGIAWWRGKIGVTPWLGGLGGVLVLAGLAIPAQLGPVYRAWMGLALVLSKVTTPIFMAVIYFGVLTPIGLIMRLVGRNTMVHKAVGGSFWTSRTGEGAGPGSMERQF
jgi:hypothetical protein